MNIQSGEAQRRLAATTVFAAAIAAAAIYVVSDVVTIGQPHIVASVTALAVAVVGAGAVILSDRA